MELPRLSLPFLFASIVCLCLATTAGAAPAGAGAGLPAGETLPAEAQPLPGNTGAANGPDIAPSTLSGRAPTNESNGSVGVGQQLATVVSVAEREVQSEVEETSFEATYERANESRRIELVAERGTALVERAASIRQENRELQQAYREREIDTGTYAQRTAVLSSRASDQRERLTTVRERAANLSAGELREAGLNRSQLQSAYEDLDSVSGPGYRALLDRFVGDQTGEFEIEASNETISIEAESEDGERSREFERSRDGTALLTINQSTALSTARESLTETDGQWVVTRSRTDRDDGSFAFEFVLRAQNTTGEAEVSVDGSSGDVFELEEEMEPRDEPAADSDEETEDGEPEQDENEEDEDSDDERDREEDARQDSEENVSDISMIVAEGTPGPNEMVTVAVTSNGEPAANATVTVDGDRAGTTGTDGTLQLTLPSEGPTVEAEYRTAEAELEFQYEPEDGSLTARNLDIEGHYDAGTVSLTVTRDGTGVGDLAVEANSEDVGRTAADGTITFEIEDTDELDLEFVKDEFETEREFLIQDEQLVPADEVEDD